MTLLLQSDLGVILKALSFAADKHRRQRRKDPEATPYINHPVALANVLVNEGGVSDPVTVCGALLHDTIEDTETRYEELVGHFGQEIADLVMEVTDDKSLPKAERKRLQIEHAAHISTRARLIKLADKISNLRDIIENPPADWSLQRQQEYFDWARQVVDRLRGTHAKLEALFDDIYAQRPAELLTP